MSHRGGGGRGYGGRDGGAGGGRGGGRGYGDGGGGRGGGRGYGGGDGGGRGGGRGYGGGDGGGRGGGRGHGGGDGGGRGGGRGYGGGDGGGRGGGRGYGGGDGGGRGGGGRGGRGVPSTEVLTEDKWMAAAAEMISLKESVPASTKAFRPPARPGVGKLGMKCVVRANHFLVEVADRDLHHYDVSISPEVTSRQVCRKIIAKLIEAHKQYLGKRIPAYDGNKSLFTAGALPFTSKDFVVNLADSGSSRAERERDREFKVTIKFAVQLSLYNLREFLAGKQLEIPQDTIQVLDVVLRASKPADSYVTIGRSFFSTTLGVGDLEGGVEYWKGYYQSLRPTQMGLSFTVDGSARPFYAPINVLEFVSQYLGKRMLSGPLSDLERVKVRRALKGITVETSYRGYVKRFKVVGISVKQVTEELFSNDAGAEVSVSQYFWTKYQIKLEFKFLPCILVGQEKRPTCIPMELCTIGAGQRYSKKLNEKQISNMLKATCERPRDKEQQTEKMVRDNKYNQHPLVNKEFGIHVSESITVIDARILPTPMLKYHESGQESRVAPGVGQWNMINKKMYTGATVMGWTCVNFSRLRQDVTDMFCNDLVQMCISKGMEFTKRPMMPIITAYPNMIEKVLYDVHAKCQSKLQLLIVILPDEKGSYGKIKRICETDLGIISQCCQPRNASKNSPQYLENVSLKINVKAGGRNTVLLDAIEKKIPMISDRPTIIIGADVTHASPGEDSVPSIAAVVASMDWPEITKYRGLISAQGPREEIIRDLYKTVQDPNRGEVHGGMIRELLIAFRRSTGQKPHRIIFYRDGVSEGQFAQVLLHEMDAIRKACASLEEGYLPRVTFVVVQKRHHTRLFATDLNLTDRSGNIIPGTVVDTKICHPSEFDFYLCSHAGIQGTSRPAHYHVLHDENNFSADLLQLLTYSLCFTYQRCTRSVSIVPPAYYAHLAAFRARYYIEGDATRDSSSGSAQVPQGTGAVVRQLPQIKENVKSVMFYC